MKLDNNEQAFFALVRAGLWADAGFTESWSHGVTKTVDWNTVYQFAEEQSVQGLVLQGIEWYKEHMSEFVANLSQNLLLQWIGEVQKIEQRNKEMNSFIADMVEKMREADIYTLLLKGQGVAQCYARPLWRPSGDVDFLLSKTNYEKAKSYLLPVSSGHKPERKYSKEMGLNIDPWYVEIHGTQRTGLSMRLDRMVDKVQNDVFYDGSVRSWDNNGTIVFLPAVDNDVFFVFTHFIKHFYKEGMILRQVCDWCRLLWTYKDSLNHDLLETRIKEAGLMAEWKSFAAMAVNYLGIPKEAMPLYSTNQKWNKKADKILSYILKGGQWNKIMDTLIVSKIFPISVPRFAPGILFNVNLLKIKERLFKSKN